MDALLLGNLFQFLEMVDVGLGVTVGFDPLHRVVDRCDVGQQRQGNAEPHGGKRVQGALEPEAPQRHVGDVKHHPGQIRSGDQGQGLVPATPEPVSRGGLQSLPAGADHEVFCLVPG